MSKVKELIIDNRCGGIVRQVRLQLNCTQAELGKKIGVNNITMCRIERRHELPTESMLTKLAAVAGCSTYQLTGQEPINYAAIY